MIKTLIFDFDGTLADSLPIAVEGVKFFAKEYNYEFKLTEKDKGRTARDLIKNELNLSFFQLYGYMRKLKEYIKARSDEIKKFENVEESLIELSKNHNIAILTTNKEDTVREVLGDLIDYVDFISCEGSLFGKHRQIKKFLRKNKLKKEECIYIGDEVRDVDACKKVGMKIISVTYGYNSRSIIERHKPDFVVDSFKEVVGVIRSLR